MKLDLWFSADYYNFSLFVSEYQSICVMFCCRYKVGE